VRTFFAAEASYLIMRIPALILWNAALSTAAWAQSAPQFEVASIKIAPALDGRGYSVSSRGGPGTQDPTLFTCHNWTLSGLIGRAFDLGVNELSGPDWMGSARFDMSAKIPDGATKEQFRQMLQSFLAERFKLACHREKKEVPAYNLVVTRNGPKFKESVPVPPPDDADRPAGKPSPIKQDDAGYPILPPGRESTMAMTRGFATQRFGDETMAHLAQNLAFQLAKPVIDATDLKGKYDFTLHWVADGVQDDAGGPNLFRAVQEQLGLKLESTKTIVDVLVVDHLEKTPTEN
jgi:uncharacterized protein (TIGR03435 family)